MFDYHVSTTPDAPPQLVERQYALLCGFGEAAYLEALLRAEINRDPPLWCTTSDEGVTIDDPASIAHLRERLREALADVEGRPPEWTIQRGYDGLIHMREGRLVPLHHTIHRAALLRFLEETLLLVHFAAETGARVHIAGGR